MPSDSDLPELNDSVLRGDFDEARRILAMLGEDDKALLEKELGSAAYRQLFRAARRRVRAKRGSVIVIPGLMGTLLDSIDAKGDSDSVWVNFWRLMHGRFLDFELKEDGEPVKTGTRIEPRSLHGSYLPILFELDTSWRVMPFPYDWRLDMADTARKLREMIGSWSNGTPVHLVAHSMGGLVGRQFIKMFPDVWESMWDSNEGKRGGRLIQMGTPNRGSFAIPMVFTSQEDVVKKLGAIDLRNSREKIASVSATFPGLYQLMPSPDIDLADDHQKLFRKTSWGNAVSVTQPLLKLGEQFQRGLHEVLTPERIVYVAGYDQKTVHRVQIKNRRLRFRITREGDGRVSHELGLLEGVRTLWVKEAHGDLPKNEQVLGGIHDLLTTGSTDHLDATRPQARSVSGQEVWVDYTGAEDPGIERIADEARKLEIVRRQAQRSLTDRLKAVELATAATEGFLGRAPGGTTVAKTPRRKEAVPQARLAIQVHWDDIRHARGDVYAVGHYEGVLPQNAEWALDEVISGTDKAEDMVLRNLTRRRMIDGRLGEVNLFPWTGGKGRTKLVAVTGMGYPGRFTRGMLRGLARKLAWRVGVLRDVETVCTVLIGSGAGGLDLQSSVRGLLEGMVDALGAGLRSNVRRLCIVEYERGRAQDILDAVKHLAVELGGTGGASGQGIRLTVRKNLVEGRRGEISASHALSLTLAAAAPTTPARRRSLNFLLRAVPNLGQREKAWEAMEMLARAGGGLDDRASRVRVRADLRPVGEETDASADSVLTRLSYIREQDRIRVAAIHDQAVVPEEDLRADFSLVKELTRKTTDPAIEDESDLSGLLSNLLLPVSLREAVINDPPVIFEVDRDLAAVHWELMSRDARSQDDPPSLGLRTIVARQLRTTYHRGVSQGPAPGSFGRAMVIGDPGDPDKDHDLPGAREEAIAVAKLLETKGFEVDTLIGPPNGPREAGFPPASRLEVLNLLFKRTYDILHYSGHGDFDHDDPTRVGWLFAGGMLTAGELHQLDHVPLLIVANACLSARTSSKVRGGRHPGGSDAALLPSLADEFFRLGAQNYVGTAWEVSDLGAILFAETLYGQFLPSDIRTKGNNTLGAAMLAARRALYKARDDYGALWLAYQHYGDPNERWLPHAGSTP